MQHQGVLQLLSVVVPAFNEEDVLEAFHERLLRVLAEVNMRYEVVYVNDGSTDSTMSVMRRLREESRVVGIVDLSRNFGKEIALTAGLDVAEGDAVIVIDADLQDPPELIPSLIERWHEGFDVVYAKRTRRLGESLLKRVTAHVFYRFMQSIGQVKIPEDTGDYRLLSKRAVSALKQLRERHRFMKGLFSWIGYRQTSIPYERDPRFAGETKWNYWRLWNLALEGITSFTTAPLRMSTYLGVFTAAGAFLYGTYMIIKTLLFGNPVAGYPSLIVVMLFLGGVQLMAIGVMGEYVGRIFNESKLRPLYLVNEFIEPERGTSADESTESDSIRSPQGVASL